MIRNGTTSAGAADATLSDSIFGFDFKNCSDTDMWVHVDAASAAAAVGTGVLVAAGESHNFKRDRNEDVSVYCASASKNYSIQEV